MRSLEVVRDLKERMADHPQPVLSAYLNVNPARPENQGRGYLLRLKGYFKSNEVPGELVQRVTEFFEAEQAKARTIVLFAAPDGLFEAYRLQVELPEDVRWGEPYIAPLALALDEHERYSIALLDGERFRFLVTSLGEVEEPVDAANPISTAGWREITLSPSAALPRGGAARDVFDRRVEAQTQRFYRELGDMLRRLISEYRVSRLILAGPVERTAEFYRALPNEVQGKVAGEASVPVEATESEVLERITQVQERSEREREAGLLTEAREKGVRGVEEVLEALQEGQVYHLLVPWPLDGEAGWCDACNMAFADTSRTRCPYCEGPVRIRPLVDTLLDLADARGARIEFVMGQNAETLREELGGLAGLRRF